MLGFWKLFISNGWAGKTAFLRNSGSVRAVSWKGLRRWAVTARERMMRMEKDLIRLLKADEIECRVSVINEKGLSLLLYKDARVDQKILDETFGAFGWKRSHQCIDGTFDTVIKKGMV